MGQRAGKFNIQSFWDGLDLRTAYYRMFFRTFVVPIIILIGVTIGSLYTVQRQAAINQVRIMHESIAAGIQEEVSRYSLMLSQFILSNDQMVLDLAGRYRYASEQERYEYGYRITQLFNLMVANEKDIIALHFYMPDETHLDLKGYLNEPVGQLRQSTWYQAALATPNQVRVANAGDTSVTLGLSYGRKRAPLVFALAPAKYLPASDVEMVCLYTYTSIAEQLARNNNSANTLGTTYLLNGSGEDLLESEPALEKELLEKLVAAEGSGKLVNGWMMKTIDPLEWRIVTKLDQTVVLRRLAPLTLIILGVALVVFVLFFLFTKVFFNSILQPLSALAQAMNQVERGRMDTRIQKADGMTELRHLAGGFNAMLDRIDALMELNEQRQREKYAEQLRALQTQINPHFIANTLGAIRFMAMAARFDNIRDMAQALIDILRTSLDDAIDTYPLAREIELLRSYVFIMKNRYADNFDVDFNVSEEAARCCVPRLILQPIMENAIIHGMSERAEPGTIQLTARLEDARLLILVRDEGIGMTPEQIRRALCGDGQNKTPIGISNVRKRLQLHYGEMASIAISSELGVFTEVRISLPAEGGESWCARC